MKKLFCFFCVLFLFVTLFNIGYAETNIIDENIPGNAPETVTSTVYRETTIEITDEGVPSSIPDVLDIIDEEVPFDAPELPDTGGVPPEVFYLVGVVFIVIGILFSLKKNKNAVKN